MDFFGTLRRNPDAKKAFTLAVFFASLAISLPTGCEIMVGDVPLGSGGGYFMSFLFLLGVAIGSTAFFGIMVSNFVKEDSKE